MDHKESHCTGIVGNNICNKKEDCKCYRLHLDAQDKGLKYVPYIEHIYDFGYGKSYIRNISNGCLCYEEI